MIAVENKFDVSSNSDGIFDLAQVAYADPDSPWNGTLGGQSDARETSTSRGVKSEDITVEVTDRPQTATDSRVYKDDRSTGRHFAEVKASLIIHEYLGRVDAIIDGTAIVTLQDNAGNEFHGERGVNEFGELSLHLGCYFRSVVVSDGSASRFQFFPAEPVDIDQETMDQIEDEVNSIYPLDDE